MYLCYFKYANIAPEKVGEKYKGSIDELRAKYCNKPGKTTGATIDAPESDFFTELESGTSAEPEPNVNMEREIGYPEAEFIRKKRKSVSMTNGKWGDFHPSNRSSESEMQSVDGTFLPDPISETELRNLSNTHICADFDDSLINKVGLLKIIKSYYCI